MKKCIAAKCSLFFVNLDLFCVVLQIRINMPIQIPDWVGTASFCRTRIRIGIQGMRIQIR
jgi:hypothetical protein